MAVRTGRTRKRRTDADRNAVGVGDGVSGDSNSDATEDKLLGGRVSARLKGEARGVSQAIRGLVLHHQDKHTSAGEPAEVYRGGSAAGTMKAR